MIAIYLGRWAQAQRDQFELCAQLELIADRLPLHDVRTVQSLALQMIAVMNRVHTFEEDELFPVLEAMSPQIRSLLITFRTHHHRDRAMLGEIASTLSEVSDMGPNALKHLKVQLSAFAEVLRRHAEFEEAIGMALFASKRIEEKRAVQ